MLDSQGCESYMRYEGYPNDFVDGHQILYAVGGQL